MHNVTIKCATEQGDFLVCDPVGQEFVNAQKLTILLCQKVLIKFWCL